MKEETFMPKHDYTKHSNKNKYENKYENKSRIERKFESADEMVEALNNQKPEVVDVAPVVVSEPEVITPAVHEVVAPVVPEIEVPKNLGKVVGCVKLNVREEPSTKASVVFEITVGSMVFIDETCSTDEFYKICTEHGVEGYCMKKFIEI